MTDAHIAFSSFMERSHRWPEVEQITVGQFRVWLEEEIVRNDKFLESMDGWNREDHKEAQMDGVALAGASVALRLFMEAMLP